MRMNVLSLMLVMVLLVSGCSQSIEAQYQEGEQLLRNREYDSAIEIFEELLEVDPLNYEVWHDLMKALVRDQQLAKASDTLTKYFETVKEDYNKNEAVSYPSILKDIMGYAGDIISGGGQVASWIDTLQPAMVNLENVPYDLEMGDLIEIDVPQDMKVYWTLDGSNPNISDETQLYTEALVANFEGEKTLTVVAVNDFGLEGPVNYTWVAVYDSPEPLTPSLVGGTYDGPIVVFFPDYDYDTMDLYYTTDGSDPAEYGFYYEETGIRLVGDTYTLRATYYDYNTGDYSKETVVEYVVTNPYELDAYTEITMILFSLNEDVASEIEYTISDLNGMEGNYYINTFRMDDYGLLLDEISYGHVDAIYSSASLVEDFVGDDVIVPVNALMDLNGDSFINHAMDAGLYEGVFYNMPVSINPNMMLYYNTYETGDDYYADIDSWDQLIDFANNGTSSNNFIYPEDMIGEWLFGYYLGFGGTIESVEGGFVLDEDAMVQAMTFAYDLSETYGLGYKGMDAEAYYGAIEDGTATMIYGDVGHMVAYDYYNTYVPAGQMPLPKGGYAGAINLVDGLMLTKDLIGNTNRENLVKMVYDAMANQYYANYIAGYGEGIPAVLKAIDEDSLWLDGEYDDYEYAVMNNVTIPYTYKMYELFYYMTDEMQNLMINGGSPQESAKALVEAFDGVE